VIAGLLLTAPPAWAQASASGIAGTVRDPSGGVLPGVTVEASSPVLIEKIRTAVTDGQGRYSITELRPGIYTVTFSLEGFSSVRREGIELTSGFTANISVDLQVGAVAETITVTGASPLVDVQNVRQQTVVARAEIEALPVGQGSTSSFVSLIAGLGDGGKVDVGGSGGAWEAGRATYGTFHGKIGLRTTMDGMRTQNTGTGKAPGYTINAFFVEEIAVETGGITAEGSASTMAMNHVPKEGSNRLSFMIEGRFMNAGMQSDNLSDALRLRGASTPQRLENLYDAGIYVGGPLRQDRLWYYAGARRWGFRRQIPGLFENRTRGQLFYTADPDRPVSFHELDQSYGGRLTWQATRKDKVAFFSDYQNLFMSHGTTGSPASAPEAQNPQNLKPSGIIQASWTSTRTNKLLLEAGAGWMVWHNYSDLQPGVPADAISILETSTSFRYNAPGSYYGKNGTDPWIVDRYVERASLAYVTGSHNFKTGIQLEEGVIKKGTRIVPGPNGGGLSYRFFNGAPNSLDLSAAPYVQQATMNPDLGIFAQDQWSISRLTLNLGLRFDYWNGYVPEQTLPATRFLPERHYARVSNVPNFKDFNPRLGAAYDVFGNGRTALKLAIGRFNDLSGLFYTQVVDPVQTSILSTTRSWTDDNKNFVPDCDLTNFARNDECGPIGNQNFGNVSPTAVRFADEVMRGWGLRPYTWDISTEVQHQLIPGLSVTGGYYHNWDGNIRALVNEAVTPADFGHFCITTPVNAQLPGGGGQQICDLYNVSNAKFGQSQSVWKKSTTLDPSGRGSTRVSDFVAGQVDARLGSGFRFGGGVDTGRTVWDNCFVVDNPQQTTIVYVTANVGQRAVDQRYCREVQSWLPNLQIKLNGSAPLPGGAALSITYQNLAGEMIQADYQARSTEIAPTLGRPLSGNTSTVTIPIIAPYAQYEDRRTQLDLRLTRTFKLGGAGRLRAMLDVYNIFNANSVLGRINTYGPRWGQPTSILPGRMLQLGGDWNF
jgi:hypothetical protein